MQIVPSKHFLEKMSKRDINELSLIGYIMIELSKNPNRTMFEITNGYCTFVVKYDKVEGKALLVTGWRGNRKSELIDTDFVCR